MVYLQWLHEENGIKTPIEMIVKVKKSVSDTYGFGGNIICNECNNDIEQVYICKICGLVHISDGGKEGYKDKTRLQHKTDTLLKGLNCIVGKKDKRKDKLTKIIYNEKDRQTFMEIKIDDKIRVEKEITKDEIVDNLYFLDTPYEIYNNDDAELQSRIRQIHNFLNKKGIILLVSFGYHGREMGGIITSTKDKLSLITLRDYKLIKEKNQIGLNERTTKIDSDLEAITSSDIPILHNEFLKAVKENKPIEKPKEIAERKPKMIEIGFLEGY